MLHFSGEHWLIQSSFIHFQIFNQGYMHGYILTAKYLWSVSYQKKILIPSKNQDNNFLCVYGSTTFSRYFKRFQKKIWQYMTPLDRDNVWIEDVKFSKRCVWKLPFSELASLKLVGQGGRLKIQVWVDVVALNLKAEKALAEFLRCGLEGSRILSLANFGLCSYDWWSTDWMRPTHITECNLLT